MMDIGDIVVGIDGSESSRQALRWAADEACRCGRDLHVVLAYRRPGGAGLLPSNETDEVAAAHAAAIVDWAVAAAKAIAPDITVTGAAVRANPAVALLDAADKARLVVVGSRGRGGFVSLSLGSVGLRIATHAPCPVAVVRGETHPGGPVVVGLNGSQSATTALPAGFAQAATRGCGVVAARAYPDTPRNHDIEELRAELIRTIAPWRSRYPQVLVDHILSRGPAAGFLTDLSHRAQLMVLGSRGSNGFTGLLLGSISQQLIHNAHCPVLIARARDGR